MRGKLPDDDSPEADFPEGKERELAWRRAVTETRAVLRQGSATWAQHSCPGTSECCQLAVTQRPPWLWPSEWKVIEARLKRDGRALPPARADGGCPLLDAAGKRCTVYEDRPLGCRTYFCHRITGPAKLPGEETNALMERLMALNLEADDGADARSIVDWLALTRTLSPGSPGGRGSKG